ncbi:MAG: peptide chain release factor N(5)-glutamine methyltransferase [Gammaproteobacteria bacterium]
MTVAATASTAAALGAARARLAPSDSARLDAELLLAHVLDCPRTRLYSNPERALDTATLARFEALVAARAAGTPLAYLTGRAEFWSLTLSVAPGVLVPRPETELLVESALELARADATIADLGTGSGAIACAVASELPRAVVVASDRDAAALARAEANVAALGLDTVRCLRSNWLAPFGAATLDLILANPPYIGTSEADGLPPELTHEPPQALFAGADGLDDLRAIAADAPRVLRVGGAIVLEHGATQGAAVRALLGAAGFARVVTRRDLAGHERVTLAHG